MFTIFSLLYLTAKKFADIYITMWCFQKVCLLLLVTAQEQY